MKKYSLIFVIIGLAILIMLMQKIILPLVYDVVKSDAFLVDSKDQASQLPISNSMTDLAFLYCNDHVKKELAEGTTISLPKKPLNVWSLGNYQYIVNAQIDITSSSGTSSKKYACRIVYEKGDNQDGVNDPENWSVEGIDGLN